MRRLGLATLIAAVACGSAYAGPLAAPSAKKASVKLERCSLEDHSALFYARMRSVPGSVRMKLKFTLLERAGGIEWEKVDSPELDQWRKSEVGVRRFGYHQEVKGLTEGLAYRVAVRYRWYDGAGAVIKRARRRSRPCRQYTALPNLKVQTLGGRSLASVWRYDLRVRNKGNAAATDVPVQLVVDGVVRYQAVVSNTGKAAATGVPVRLTVDGDVVDTVTFASLAPGEQRSVAIRGPQCDRLVKLEADPEQAIAESSDDDNVFELSCAALR